MTMKRLIATLALLATLASPAMAEYVSGPSCFFFESKPYKPFQFTSQFEVDSYNQQVDSYNDARARYIKCIDDYVDAHRKAANDAIDSSNSTLSFK
jgi:hypothetical protein